MPYVLTADSPIVASMATLVSEPRRSGFLPRLFGKRLALYGEMRVYNFMQSSKVPEEIEEPAAENPVPEQ